MVGLRKSDHMEGRCRGRHVRAVLHCNQGQDQPDARQGRGSGRDAGVQLPEADGAAPERQEGHRRRRHVQEAPPAPAAEARAAGRQAGHAGAAGARAESRGSRARRARAQAVRPDRTAVARRPGPGARGPAAVARRQGAEAAVEDRPVPDQEGGHQGAVLRRRGLREDLRGRVRRGRGDGRRRHGDAARGRQDREHARPRERDGRARGLRRVRRPALAHRGAGRHRPPVARAVLGLGRRRRPRAAEGRARPGRAGAAGARLGRGAAPSQEKPA